MICCGQPVHGGGVCNLIRGHPGLHMLLELRTPTVDLFIPPEGRPILRNLVELVGAP